MGRPKKFATPDNTDSEESGEVFTDGDFDDSDDDLLNCDDNDTSLTVNETINMDVKNTDVETNGNLNDNGFGQVNSDEPKVNGLNNGHISDTENYSSLMDLRRDANSGEQSPSIVGILGSQQNYVRIVFLSTLLVVNTYQCIFPTSFVYIPK